MRFIIYLKFRKRKFALKFTNISYLEIKRAEIQIGYQIKNKTLDLDFAFTLNKTKFFKSLFIFKNFKILFINFETILTFVIFILNLDNLLV